MIGISFLLQALLATPGREVTSLPNLVLRRFRRQLEVP